VKILVLYVDRDGDIKQRGFNTPAVGRDEVLRLGIRYILQYPDDSDANAVFAAVKIYDKLADEIGRENVEVAVVSGNPDEALANLAVLEELKTVLSIFDADAVYFVSDGPADEGAISAIQTKRPVISVYRVVVKQARGVEETVTLVRHYLTKAVKEPEYRRYTVGVPSVLFFLYVLSAFLNIENIIKILQLLFLFIMFILILYGFGVYDLLKAILRKYEITFFIAIIVLFVIILDALSELIGQPLTQPLSAPVVATVSITPFIAYITESYVKTRSIKNSVFPVVFVIFGFFYFLMPTLLDVFKDPAKSILLISQSLYFTIFVLAGVLISLLISRVLSYFVK